MEICCLRDLIYVINCKLITRVPNIDITVKGVSVDSRTIKRNEIYFAIPGSHYDGHSFIKEAIDKGAAAVVYSRDNVNSIKLLSKSHLMFKTNDTLVALGEFAKAYRTRFQSVKIVGITGSNGKTTSKEILTSILSKKGKTLSNEGNFNNRIGLPLTLFNLDSSIKYAIFEMGTSLHGEIKILSDILNPDAGIITNIGFSHLKTFISRIGVFEEKIVLFDSIKKNGLVIVNNDDKFLRTIFKNNSCEVITFALDRVADVYARNIVLAYDKTYFELFYEGLSVKVTMPVNGRFNVENALAAASCAVGLGFSLDEIKCGIENFTPPKMRMETVVTINGVILINDAYNANPSSIRKAIQTVLQSYSGKKINLVLGDMLELGDKSDDYHFELGKFISIQNINSVYLFGEMSFNVKEALDGKNVFYSKDKNGLLRKLEQIHVDNNSVFLFKASRDMKLEEIYMKFYSILKKRGG